MYIVFSPYYSFNLISQFQEQLLKTEIHKWASKYGITPRISRPNITSTVHRIYVEFDKDNNYSLFLLSWYLPEHVERELDMMRWNKPSLIKHSLRSNAKAA